MVLIELNEAFAAQVLDVLREWSLPDGLERVNVNGSGISLGHPVGATGARILATLLRELHRRDGRYGLETMCIGGGAGRAAGFQRAGHPPPFPSPRPPRQGPLSPPPSGPREPPGRHRP